MPAGRKVFHVPVAIEEAWAFLSSMERVGRCVPGCEDVCAIDDRRSSWTVRADMGPFSRRLQMEAMTIEFDPPRHGAFRATGKGLETVGSIDLRAISVKETEVAYAITASARGFGATLIDNAIALVIQNQAEQFAANVKANLKEASSDMSTNTEFSGITLEDLVQPSKAALVVVDMQNDFCHSDGSLAKRGSDVHLIQEMAPKLRNLLAHARETGIPIVHIRTHHSPWTNSPSWQRRRLGTTVRCFPDSWGADWYEGFEPRPSDEWTPERHEYVVTKHRYSGFLDTDLDLILRSHGIESLIMTGEATNVCVESTARDGYMKDYFIVFTSDGTATNSVEEHEATLVNMRKHFGMVVTSDEITAAWRKMGALREAVAV